MKKFILSVALFVLTVAAIYGYTYLVWFASVDTAADFFARAKETGIGVLFIFLFMGIGMFFTFRRPQKTLNHND